MNFPDLHRHLGGATHARILWGWIEKHGRQTATAARLREQFPDYAAFSYFFNRPFTDLADYLSVHHLVEELQSEELAYFTHRAVRGAWMTRHRAQPVLDFSRDERNPIDQDL